jgi:hypothetical protein
VVQLAQGAGLVKLGRVGIDGTKVRASASKHKAMSYGRTLKSEKRLRREIEPVVGWIKQRGFRSFSLWGLAKTTGEWDLVCPATNLRRMHVLAPAA